MLVRVDVTVEDTIAPTLIVSLSPNVINANNHKLVAVSASSCRSGEDAKPQLSPKLQ